MKIPSSAEIKRIIFLVESVNDEYGESYETELDDLKKLYILAKEVRELLESVAWFMSIEDS